MKKNLLGMMVIVLAAAGVVVAQDYDYVVQSTPSVPVELKVPDGNKLLMKILADGVQIYTCSAKSDNSGYEWVFKAPEANLMDEKSTKLGIHYGGPSWEANDGSKITGTVRARANSTDSNAIPWLLLEAKSAGKDGSFAKVAFIQRLETVSGKAPASGCDQANLNKEARVGYTATYYMYGK